MEELSLDVYQLIKYKLDLYFSSMYILTITPFFFDHFLIHNFDN